MKLRSKTLIIISITVIILIGILLVASNNIMLQGVANAENKSTRRDMERALAVLSHEISNLNSTTLDYAAWNDTYAFIQNNSTDYITANLMHSTFVNLRLNFMLFVNSTGQTVYGKALDLANETEMPVPHSLQEHLSDYNILLQHENTASSVGGIVLLPEGPSLVASRPILTNDRQGPIRGALILGRFLDSVELEYLNQAARLPLTVQTYDDPQAAADFKTAQSSLSKESPIFVLPLSEETVSGYALLEDIYGQPVLILRADVTRDQYAQGVASVTYFVLSLTAVGAVFGFMTILLLEKFVLSRLSKLSKTVHEMGMMGDFTARISIGGKDELSALGVEINRMLSNLGQKEQRIRDERDRAQRYLDIAGVIIVALDASGKISVVNRKGCEVLGCIAEEALGKDWFETYVPCRVQDEVRSIFRSLMKGDLEPAFPLEYNENPVLTQDGEERLIAWNNTVLRDAGGRIVGTLSSGIDVTEQKQVEKALRENELRLHRITENMLDMIGQTDLNGIVQYSSYSTKRVLGYNPEDMVGKFMLDLAHPGDQDKVMKTIRESLRTRSFGKLEFRAKHADGHYIWLETIGNFIFDEKRQAIGTVFNSRDVTERKRAEQTLKESEEKYRGLVELAPDGIVAVNTEGIITSANRSFLTLVGYDSEEVVGKPFMELKSGRVEDIPKMLEMFKSLMKGESPSPVEFLYVRRDGTSRWAEVHPSLLVKDGNPVGAQVIMRDVSERKNAEKLIQENQQKFEQLFMSNPEAAIFADANDHVRDFNPRFSEIFGYSSEEILGKALDDLIVPDDKKKEAEKLTQESAIGYVHHETVRKRKDGLPVPVLISAAPITIEGQFVGYIVLYEDITERKRMEEQLREAEQKFRGITERSFDVIVTTDAEGRITYVSPSVERILGFQVDEMIGKPFQDYFVGIGLSEALQTFARLLNGETLKDLQLEMSRRDGSPASIEINVSPILKDGDVIGIQGIARDVTERKRMENAIRESEERLRQLVEYAPDVIYASDLNGTFTDGNKQAEALLGYKKEELIGKNMIEIGLISEKCLPKILEMLQKNINGQKAGPEELELIKKDGNMLVVEASAFPVKRGEKIEVLGIVRDVTERKKIEEALRESEEKLRNVIESSPDAIVLVDIKGSLVDCNRATMDMFGFSSKEEVVGKNGFEFIGQKDFERSMEYMQKILEHGVVRNIEYVLKDRCGQEFPVETSASIVKNALGEPQFIVGVIKDITERKKMEERLSALNFYGSNLNTAKSFDEVYALILDTMQQTLGFEYGEFLTIERSKLHTVCYRGQPREIPDLPLDGEKKGIVVKAANMRKPILVRDVTKEADYVEALPEAKSELTVPVVTENRLLGVLNVESTRADSFDEKDVALLQILASHAATAIGNLEKRVEIEKRSNQLALLMKNSAVIMHVAGLHRRIQTIAEAVQELGWRRVVITARDEKLNIASSGDIVTAGLTKEEKEYMWTNRQSGEVWQERFGTEYDRFKIGQFYYMPWNDPWVRERFDKGTVPSRLKPEEMVDWNPDDLLYAPIRLADGRIVGVVSIDDPADGKRPTRESLVPLELFLYHVAVAIENAKLIQQLKEYSEHLEEKVEERTQKLKETQERLIKAERLATIGQVAAMVGHDLRNPLTGINGAAYYLKTRPALKRSKKIMEMLELIEKDVEYSNKIITDLLEYSREIQLELTETNPKSIIKETLTMITIPQNVHVLDLTHDEPAFKIDMEKMRRVFINLVRNAIDAMPNGGELKIDTKVSETDVILTFTDTGTGMTREVMEKIWAPFFTTKAKGMGLGLSICKRIVEAHSGKISVESTVGKGTVFTLTIPIQQKIVEGGEKIWVNLPESLLSTTTKASEKS